MSEQPNSINQTTQQTHSSTGDNVGGDKNSSYYSEIGGDFKGIQGNISGGVINQYIVTQQSSIEITKRNLITGSPYKGLEKFKVEDKDKFFGREDWITRLTEHLQTKSVLLLLGASGSGKSSLIQAGVIPKLTDEIGSINLVNLTFVPDVNPFKKFSRSLDRHFDDLSKAEIAEKVAEDTLIKVVGELKEEDKTWLIFIDQFEELFTRTPEDIQKTFIKGLMKLIERENNSLKIVMTMRADFLDRFAPYSELGSLHNNYGKLLTDMSDNELRLAIAEPVAKNGVIFEAGLIEQIIGDFRRQRGALPLLQYTLDLLWKNDNIIKDKDRLLNKETYEKIGKVSGALTTHANSIYKDFNEQEQKATRAILFELIGLEGNEPVSKRINKQILEQDKTQKEVLDVLIKQRLLVSNTQGEEATLEVAHEELLRSWDVVKKLIEDKQELIIIRNRLDADAQQCYELYKTDKRKAIDELWQGSKLDQIVQLIKQKAFPNLDNRSKKFVKASIKYQQKRQQAEINTQLSLANSLAGYARSLFDSHQQLEALIEAFRAGKIIQKYKAVNRSVTETLSKLLSEVKEFNLNRLEGHDDSVNSVSFNHDGTILASVGVGRDSTIKLWDVNTGEVKCTLKGHKDSVNSVIFNHDGSILASGSNDKTIKLWDVNTGEVKCNLEGHKDSVWPVSFNREGTILASVGRDNTIKLWDVKTGEVNCSLEGHNDDYADSVIFNHDGSILASGSNYKTIKLWDVNTGEVICTIEVPNNYVNSVIFNHDGSILASKNNDNTIKLWDVNTREVKCTLEGHKDSVNSVSFNYDGSILASGSYDKTIKLWDVNTGEVIRTLEGHDDFVNSVSFNHDGTILASGSYDKTIKLWYQHLDWDLDLDAMIKEGCKRLRPYLTHNPNVSAGDRKLCDTL